MGAGLLLAVHWGTSRLRARLLDAAGREIAATESGDGIGQISAGLFFLGYQQDPRRQFVSIQKRLAANDLLNEYLFHTGSAIFAIPPGVQPGGSIGDTLFA